jgi:hypothetical protein
MSKPHAISRVAAFSGRNVLAGRKYSIEYYQREYK